jgi:uncharacterized protein (TIGR00369 family)
MAAIWTRPLSTEILHAVHAGTAPEHLGLEFLEVGDDFIRARVPVDARTCQPLRILHGGVSVLLAETLGSCGAAFSVPEGRTVVGLDINANHLRSVRSGWVNGITRPIHRGRSTHVWQIDLSDEQGRPVCVSRLTLAVLEEGGTAK